MPDREPATAQAWLSAHPTIAVVARARGGGYGEAAAKALPCAVQVADRWHLMENANRAFLDAVRKSMRQIRCAIGGNHQSQATHRGRAAAVYQPWSRHARSLPNSMMIRRSASAELLPWIERARASLVASFARGVTNDEVAVQAAITSSWSNGQTEGQITRVKLVKRQMYGRGKIDLLQARLVGAE